MTKEEIKERIIAIIDNYTTEMEGYSYCGSNPGVRVDDYENIAEDICKEFVTPVGTFDDNAAALKALKAFKG
jgi:hypothetical protein